MLGTSLVLALCCIQLCCGNGPQRLQPFKMYEKNRPIPSYVVNLDAPPRERWNHVLKDFDGQLVVKAIEEALSEMEHNALLRSLSVKIAGDLERYLPQPYADELRGISDGWNVDLGYMVIANIFYDIVARTGSPVRACTSIVTVDGEGQMIHGRNLDFLVPEYLRNITTILEFQQNQKTLFHSVSYAGQIGIVTAVKPGAFSLTLNERNTGFWWENLVSAFEGSWPALFYVREIMVKAEGYEAALQSMKKMRTISPFYIILGGPNPYEGSVVVGDRWGASIERMNNTHQHGWFIVETNYDPWTTPPTSDDRRDGAIKLIKELGQTNMNLTSLYQVLSTPPILNEQTVYTTLMSAHDASVFRTVIRHPPISTHRP